MSWNEDLKHGFDAIHDWRNQFESPRADQQHGFIEPAKPRHLEKFWPRDIEDKGGNANTHQFGKHDDGHRAYPIMVCEQPETQHLQRE